MNSRDLLCAIAGTDEAFLTESARFDAVSASAGADRKRLWQRAAAVGAMTVLCVAVFALLKQTPPAPEPCLADTALQNGALTASPTDRPSTPAGIPGTQEPVVREDVSGTSATQTPGGEPRGPDASVPPTAAEPVEASPQTEPSPPAEATSAPAEEPTSASEEPGGQGNPRAVFTSRTVDYGTAKEAFAHPIVPGAGSDFVCYSVGIVSQTGDPEESDAFCLSVTYTFTNGRVTLTDQDRLRASSASDDGERYVYRDRTFYVRQYNGGGVYENRVQIGYYPTWDRGIAYQADFAEGTDIYEIMEKIVSVEF